MTTPIHMDTGLVFMASNSDSEPTQLRSMLSARRLSDEYVSCCKSYMINNKLDVQEKVLLSYSPNLPVF